MQIQVTTKAELGKSTRLWDLARWQRILKYFSAALAVCVQLVCWIQAPIAIIASWNYQVLDCPTEGKAGWRGAHCFLRRFTYSLFFAQVHIFSFFCAGPHNLCWISVHTKISLTQTALWWKFQFEEEKGLFSAKEAFETGVETATLAASVNPEQVLGSFFFSFQTWDEIERGACRS